MAARSPPAPVRPLASRALRNLVAAVSERMRANDAGEGRVPLGLPPLVRPQGHRSGSHDSPSAGRRAPPSGCSASSSGGSGRAPPADRRRRPRRCRRPSRSGRPPWTGRRPGSSGRARAGNAPPRAGGRGESAGGCAWPTAAACPEPGAPRRGMPSGSRGRRCHAGAVEASGSRDRGWTPRGRAGRSANAGPCAGPRRSPERGAELSDGTGADGRDRTGDIQLGKLTFYPLNYARANTSIHPTLASKVSAAPPLVKDRPEPGPGVRPAAAGKWAPV